jgi:pilus assembly protein CpaE
MSVAGARDALRVTLAMSAEQAAQLNLARLSIPDTVVSVHTGDLMSFVSDEVAVSGTDVLVVEIDPSDAGVLSALEKFTLVYADRLPVVAAVRELSIQITRRLLRASIVDVVPLPFTEDELAQAIHGARDAWSRARPPVPKSGPAPRQGKVISFLGALGGVGATSISTQLGVLWSGDRKVCLIDLDLQFGNAALYLNLRPRLTVIDLIEAGDRMDADYLASVAEVHTSGMAVVGAPLEIVPLDVVTPESVRRMLALAAERYDVVLVDLPREWINWTAAAMASSTLVVLVSEMSVAGVHQARRQLDMFDANGLSGRVRLLLNRVATSMFRKADLSQAEQTLKRRVDHILTNDYAAMSAAIDEGRPLSKIKIKSRLEKDLRQLLAELDQAQETVS